MKYEFPLSSYTRVGEFTLSGLAEGEVPQEIGKVTEMRIRVLGHNSENWIILSEVIIIIPHEVFASRGDSEKNPSSRWDSNPRPSVI